MVKLVGDGPVIVVDDNSDALLLAKIGFEESKITNRLILLDSGKALIDYLKEVKEARAEMPSLILLDVSMPRLDGHETLLAIRADEKFCDFPKIIMFTSSNDPEDAMRASKGGATAYQMKPFGLDEYLSFIASLAP